MWCSSVVILFVLVMDSAIAKPIDDSQTDASLIVSEYLQQIESVINHLVVSRDMHRSVRRHKRQTRQTVLGDDSFSGFGTLGGTQQLDTSGLNGLTSLLGSGGNGIGGIGTGSFAQGDIYSGLNGLASLGSLDSLASGGASALGGPVAPLLQGIGQANNVMKQVVGLDRMRCSQRLACEFMANRGLFNRSSTLIPPLTIPALTSNRNASQVSLNLSNPSTFRSVLGVLQLMRLHEFGAYPHIEAGLWGVAHRDHSRCRTQFSNCPSTSEAFINELNSTPGGVQSMLTNALQAVRAIIPGSGEGLFPNGLFGSGGGPQVAANVADSAGSLTNFGQQGLGSLSGLGTGVGGQQQFLNQLGGLGQNLLGSGLNAGSQFGNQFAGQFGNQFAGQGLNLGGAGGLGSSQFNGQFGSNQFAGGLNSLNAGLGSTQFGSQQLTGQGLNALGGLGSSQFAGQFGNQFSGQALNGLNLGSAGATQFGSQLAGAGQGLNGLNLGSAGLGATQFGSQFAGAGQGLNGLNLGSAGLGATQFGSQFAGAGQGLNGLNLGSAGLGSSQFGNQFSGVNAGLNGLNFGSGGLGSSQFAGQALNSLNLGTAGQFGNQFSGVNAGLNGLNFGSAGLGSSSQFGSQFGNQFAGRKGEVPNRNRKSDASERSSSPKWKWAES